MNLTEDAQLEGTRISIFISGCKGAVYPLSRCKKGGELRYTPIRTLHYRYFPADALKGPNNNDAISLFFKKAITFSVF